MSKRFTINDLKAKNIHVSPDGKGKRLPLVTHIKSVSKKDIEKLEKELAAKKAVKQIKYSPEKDFIYRELLSKYGELLKLEYLGIKGRKFRFDWAIPSKMLAFEYNGLFSAKSRHTTPTGYTRDMTKINQAQLNGWRIFQYTALNYKEIIEDLKNL